MPDILFKGHNCFVFCNNCFPEKVGLLTSFRSWFHLITDLAITERLIRLPLWRSSFRPNQTFSQELLKVWCAASGCGPTSRLQIVNQYNIYFLSTELIYWTLSLNTWNEWKLLDKQGYMLNVPLYDMVLWYRLLT